MPRPSRPPAQVLEIDPRTRTVSTFGNLGDVHSTKECEGTLHCGEEKWIGGVLMPSTGKIIAIPYAAETVLEIDPATRTTSTFGIVSSSVRRKWVDGVLGRNGLVYAIPYDADVVLEINPETRALMLFGRVGADPCKWYGGVLGPNDKIYAIPYSSPYVLEIDTERRIARPFAMTFPHWGKWSGGVLAPNGRIYAMPALAKSVLEIDVEREQTSLFGMLPGGEDLQDKWSGGVLAPNGRIYGMPWRADKVLEFDPATKALALLGTSLGASNFSWGGGVVAKSGRIVTVPYNGAWILEIGESVCVPSHPASDPNQQQLPPPVVLPTNLGGGDAIHHGPVMPGPVTKPLPTLSPAKPMPTVATTPTQALQPAQDAALALLSALRVQGPGPKSARGGAPSTTDAQTTFVLALLGCPDTAKAAEDSCFHLAHRTWHSAMVTLMSPRASLATIREQVCAKTAQPHAHLCRLLSREPFRVPSRMPNHAPGWLLSPRARADRLLLPLQRPRAGPQRRGHHRGGRRCRHRRGAFAGGNGRDQRRRHDAAVHHHDRQRAVQHRAQRRAALDGAARLVGHRARWGGAGPPPLRRHRGALHCLVHGHRQMSAARRPPPPRP